MKHIVLASKRHEQLSPHCLKVYLTPVLTRLGHWRRLSSHHSYLDYLKFIPELYNALDARDGVIDAPKHIKLLSSDLKNVYSVLATIQRVLDDEQCGLGVTNSAALASLS